MPTERNLVHIEGIGPVLFRSDRRCKRLSIRVKPFEGITVLFPPGYPPGRALAFLKEKKKWVIKNKEKIEAREECRTVFDENTDFRTRSFALKVQKEARSDIRIQLDQGILNVFCPDHVNMADAPVQEAIRSGIEEAMRREAQNILPRKVYHFASQYQFKVKRVFIKNLKSRWGSCSAVNNINLNLQLMRLPDHLIDYVVLHELCHTVEKNHGPSFWNLLNQVTRGRAKHLAAEMQTYRTTIY
ncbi:MAG: SprT family zinc-dependent metalloprotease [Marinilabilia sp.]